MISVVEIVAEDLHDRVGSLPAGRSRVVRAMVAFVAAPQRGVGDLGAFGVEGGVEEPDTIDGPREVRPLAVVAAGLLLRSVAIEMTVERVAPLAADVRDIFGPALERDVDERRFEHRELPSAFAPWRTRVSAST